MGPTEPESGPRAPRMPRLLGLAWQHCWFMARGPGSTGRKAGFWVTPAPHLDPGPSCPPRCQQCPAYPILRSPWGLPCLPATPGCPQASARVDQVWALSPGPGPARAQFGAYDDCRTSGAGACLLPATPVSSALSVEDKCVTQLPVTCGGHSRCPSLWCAGLWASSYPVANFEPGSWGWILPPGLEGQATCRAEPLSSAGSKCCSQSPQHPCPCLS